MEPIVYGSGTVHTNGFDSACTVAGAKGAPAVAFVHGLAASKEVWEEQARRLSPGFRSLRYDLRSHGRSAAVDRPCTRADLASDLLALLDALEIERAAVVGHSAGGVIAMQAALDYPERVAALVLVGTASECNDRAAAWYKDTADKARASGGAQAMRSMGIDSREGPVPDGAGFARVALAMRSLNAEPLTERLRNLAMPVLILVGEKDFLGVGGSVILQRAIPGSELEIVPGHGHALYLEDPNWFGERLLGFLDRVSFC